MRIRRPVAAFLTALALAGGGALTACSSPTSSTTGTPIDHAKNTHGANPGGASQGNLPFDSNRVTSTPADRVGGNHKGTP